MTVSSSSSFISYVCNGGTQDFPVPFYFLEETDLVVHLIKGESDTVLTLSSDYTVSGAGAAPNGNVHTNSVYPNDGSMVYIERVVDLTQLTQFVPNTPTPASAFEQALDKLTMGSQQLSREIGSVLQLSTASVVAGVSPELPEPAANEALGWNNGANALVNIPLADQTTGTYSPGYPGAVATRLIADKLRETVSVMDFGAVGGGVANDTAAFTAALAYASTVSCDVRIPAGVYLIDPITVPERVCLHGPYRGPFDIAHAPDPTHSVSASLLVNSTGSSFITLTGWGASVKDVLIYYPQQVAPTATTPNVYPPAIDNTHDSTGGHFISGVTIVNAYDGIKLTNGRSAISDCYIGAMHYGIVVDGIADFVWINNTVHQVLWDTYAGLGYPQNIDQWVTANSHALWVGRCDGLMVQNMEVFARRVGMSMNDGVVAAGASYGRLINFDFDTVQVGVLATSVTPQSTWFLAHGRIGAIAAGGVITNTGQVGVLLQSGGTYAPKVSMIGGTISSSGWASGQTGVNAGTLKCTEVNNVTGTGLGITPSMPASGSALTAGGVGAHAVYISGGTVTGIAVNGTATGLTSGTFILQPGWTITLTYSAAPSWTWFNT